MKRIIMTIAAMFLAAGAQAQILSPTAGAIAGAAAGSVSTSGAAAGATSVSNPTQVNVMSQGQDQQQGQAQGQKQSSHSSSGSISGAAASQGNTQGVTFNSPGTIDYSGKYTVISAPPVAIGGPASGPCNGLSAGLGLSLPGFGLLGNMSKVDEGCEERETARMLGLLGRMDDAVAVLKSGTVWQRHVERTQAAQKKAEVDQKMASTSAPASTIKTTSTSIMPYVAPVTTNSPDLTDPFIRARLGK